MMKYLLPVLILLFVLPVHAQDSLNQAITACTNGDYAAGIAPLEQAVTAGAHDANLYYDLGVCYAGAGQRGKALVNLLRAAKSLPRDEDISTQIDRIRAERADLPEDESDALTLAGTVTGRMMTISELAALVLIVWSSFFSLLMIYRLRPAWQISLRIALTTVMIVLAALLILMVSRIYVESSRPAAVVIVPTVRAMSGPGDDYLPLFTLSDAAEVRILETRSGWNRVALPGGRQGWVRLETVESVNQ